MRRRLRFLRRARELAYRDLGGLVFEMHRNSQRRDELVTAKLTTLDRIDTELRTLEGALNDRGHVTVLREAGVTACPRCAAIHASEDQFCPACGLAMGRHADRPIAATPATAPLAGSAPVSASPPAIPAPQAPAAPALPLPPPPAPSAQAVPSTPPARAVPSTPPASAGPGVPAAEQPTQVIPAVTPEQPDAPSQDEQTPG
jgi:hypothetical protein